ncbi:carboxymuconolactone decarboxylase family protein [Leifsonia sp. YIM 134122]|uniref:Carboxymuconolactone decarboxylase family protein n=1 Tax=Leifsonia stereocauli TaxID=3134136 RepID=A0ABU9W7B3_9MICO
MTTTDTFISIPVRIDFDSATPGYSRAMSVLDEAATAELDRVGFDARLRELVRLRASQLNGCAYCVDQHSRAAVAVGDTHQRVHAVAVWKESGFFTARERAALAFTESVTRLADTHVPDEVVDEARAVFSDDEVGALLAAIVTINAWNAIAVATRAWRPRRDRD